MVNYELIHFSRSLQVLIPRVIFLTIVFFLYRCFCCQTFVDTKHSTLKDASQFIKRHHKLRLSSQSNNKTGTAPVIALGPPPPPPQPDSTPVENNQYKSMISKNKMNNRNKAGMYNSNWDHGSRDDWPLVSS